MIGKQDLSRIKNLINRVVKYLGIRLERIVYVKRMGKKYHQAGCRYYFSKGTFAISIDDALVRGYTACSICKNS